MFPRRPASLLGTMAVLFALVHLPAAGAANAAALPGTAEIRALLKDGRYGEGEAAARRVLAERENGDAPALEVAEACDLLAEALWRGGQAATSEARQVAARAVTLKEAELGPDQAEVAISLKHLSIITAGAGDTAGARTLAERARAILEATRGPDDVELAAVLGNLGNLLSGSGDLAAARRLYEQALAIREARFGPDAPEVAASLSNLATLLRRQNDLPQARLHLERALAIQEKALRPDHPELGATLNNLGNLLAAAGDYAGARPLLERALAIQELALSPDHPDLIRGLSNLGALLVRLGDLAAARPLLERALALRESSLGPEHADVAASLTNLANLERAAGELEEARAYFERALAIKTAIYGPDHLEVAIVLNNMANVLSDLGDLVAARQTCERALAIREKQLGPDHADVASTLNNLGTIYRNLGEFDEALRSLRRALAIEEKVKGIDHLDLARPLSNLALVLKDMGRPEEAIPYIDRALRIRERALPESHPLMAQTLNNLARVRLAAGDLAVARSAAERARAIFDETLPAGHPSRAVIRHSLGKISLAEDRLDDAETLLREALAIAASTLGTDHPLHGEILIDLAAVSLRQGEIKAAFAQAIAAERALRQHLRLTARALSEREMLGYGSSGTEALDLALSALVGGGAADAGAIASAWEAVIGSRALVLEEIARRHAAAREAEDPATRLAMERLSSARNRLARLAVSAADAERPEAYLQAIRVATADKERWERRLGDQRETDAGDIGLPQVRAALPADAALVGFVRYRRHLAGPVPPRAGTSKLEAAYLAFVLPARDPSPRVIALGTAREVDEAVGDWRLESSTDPRGVAAGTATPDDRVRSAGERARRLIWDPLPRSLGQSASVFLVPDGLLLLVNLLALPTSGNQFLLESGPLLQMLSAERDLVRLERPAPVGDGLLLVGDPAFDATPGLLRRVTAAGGIAGAAAGSLPGHRGAQIRCDGLRALRFQALPGAQGELAEIRSIWSRVSRPGGVEGERIVLLDGEQASEGKVKQMVAGFRVLHFATHGYVANALCATSPASPGAGSARGAGGEGALLVSGLALAGVNRRNDPEAASAPDDGLLTAEEIASLDLSAADWAVLAACDTGTGDLRDGEGVMGLRRAFAIAGARTLLMSLWKVDDQATRAWMRALYEARASGLSTPAAVRQAGMRLVTQQRQAGRTTHPFFWAGFVAVGDWR